MATVLKLPVDSLRSWGRDRKSHGMIGLMSYSHLALEGCHHFLPVIVPLLVINLGVDYGAYIDELTTGDQDRVASMGTVAISLIQAFTHCGGTGSQYSAVFRHRLL